MKKSYCIIWALAAFLWSCGSPSKDEGGRLISFQMNEVTRSLDLELSELATVEYARLGGEDQGFLFQSEPMLVTDDRAIVFEHRTGEVFLFDQAGNPLHRFNHRGEGPGEYSMITGMVFDEAQQELYLYFQNKIEVYDPRGTHRRTLTLGTGTQVAEAVDFDANHLLIYDANEVYKRAFEMLPGQDANRPAPSDDPLANPSPFQLISKQTGEITRFLHVPANPEIKLVAAMQMNGISLAFPARTNRIVQNPEGVILYNQETDTLFLLAGEGEPRPLAVREPAVVATDPLRYLNGYLETAAYQFFESVPLVVEKGRFMPDYLCRDKRTGETFVPRLTLADYAGKELNLSPATIQKSADPTLGFVVLTTEELLTALEENRLSGPLKTLAEGLGEDDNYVVARLRFK